MAPLGWSGGSQFSSMVFPFGLPIMISMRGGVGAVGIIIDEELHTCLMSPWSFCIKTKFVGQRSTSQFHRGIT